MPLRQIIHNSTEYRQMIKLRQEILPEYSIASITSEQLEKEKNDILLAAFDEQQILGCCILSENGPGKATLKDMAVTGRFQGMGVGASLLNYAENIAIAKGINRISLNCPVSALQFYEKAGYQICGNQFTHANTFFHPIEKILR